MSIFIKNVREIILWIYAKSSKREIIKTFKEGKINKLVKNFIIVLFLITPIFNLAASSELSDLRCGSFTGEFSYYFNMFSGTGSNTSQFRANPVFCCGLERSQVSAGISLPLKLEISGYEDFMNDEIDSVVGSVAADTIDIQYPESTIRAGQIGGIRDMEYYFKSNNAGYWGLSLWQPFGIAGNLTANSVEMTMKTDSGLREQSTVIVLGNDIAGELALSFEQSRLGWGWMFPKGINAAIGVDVYHLSVNLEGSSKTEGFIRQYGEDTDIIQSFNNPVDGQYYRNSLNNYCNADFDDYLTGFNAGISYYVDKEIMLDLGFSQPVEENISGSMQGVVRQLGAVNYESLIGESDDPLFDELLLEPSRMTYTNQTEYVCDDLIMSYPGSVKLGAGLNFGEFSHQINFSAYLGEFSFRYKGRVIDSGREKTVNGFSDYENVTESDYKYGMKMKTKFEYSLKREFKSRLGIFLNLQYMKLEEVVDNIKDSSGELVEPNKDLLFLSASGGLSYHFSENLSWDLRVMGFPGTFIDSKLTYRFGG